MAHDSWLVDIRNGKMKCVRGLGLCVRTVYTLHNPVEGEGLEEREHEQRTEEHVF